MNDIQKRNYAKSETGELYIRAQDCGISMLILLTDQIPITIWKGDQNQWIKVSVVIDWYKKEINREMERNGSKDMFLKK